MTPDLLQQLRDIHEPAAVSWWPPAMGWWLVLGAIIIVWGVAWHLLFKRKQRLAAKKQALVEIEKISVSDLSPNDAAAQLSQLMRRLIRHYYPEKQVDALSGDAWLHVVLETAEEKNLSSKIGSAILDAAYADTTTLDRTTQCDWVRQWVGAVF
ncbi:MAG: hypothetical protein DHS20C10_02760 [marine bacterium B5-7]|nr:MAG: hypothetical protein DHS20C10_02760 [marine bacterium B5-7]